MYRKAVGWLLICVMAASLFSGCSSPRETISPELPSFEKPAEEQSVADGFDALGGSWVVAGFYYKNKLIDLSDSDELLDIYDTVYLSFYEGGTFHYINIYNYRGEYSRRDENSFILKTETVFTYDFAETGLVEKEKEGASKTSYIIKLLDENTLIWNILDPATGKEKADAEPLLFEREDTESAYILQHKTPLKTESESTATAATAPPVSAPAYTGSQYDSGTSTQSTTSGMRNALASAKNYLAVMPFSHAGLIEQLEFEGYTYSEAKYAADNCGANWNEQAAKSAQNYLDLMPFSRSELIEQLEFEGYTHSQAVYGVDKSY